MDKEALLQENYEDARFALLMHRYALDEGNRLLELNRQLQNDPDAAVPEDLDRRCLETIKRGGRKKRRTFRTALIAAAIVATLMLFVTMTASAMDVDIWGALANWTQETFNFSAWGVKDEDASQKPNAMIPPLLEQMQSDMLTQGADASVLPTWLPDGYEIVEYEVSDIMPNLTSFFLFLARADKRISLSYHAYAEMPFISTFEKDEGDPELYEKDGITYYIMTNFGKYRAAWTKGNLECSISGLSTYEELTNIIDSINGGS